MPNYEDRQRETLARDFYTAYSKAVGGKNFKGDPLPTAEEFFTDETKKPQADAWREVSRQALIYTDQKVSETRKSYCIDTKQV